MFHQRHTDAADHAADALAAGRLRIDDAPGTVGANNPAHARFAKIRVDRDLHEHGPEGVHREAASLVTWLYIGRDFDWLTNAAHRLDDIVTAATSERILARFAACSLHGAADARHRHRTAMHRRPRQPCVAKNKTYPLDRQAERLGRYLRHRCPGARPHIARCARHDGGAIGQETRHRGSGGVVHRISRGCHTPADQPAPVAHRAWLGVAPAPAETFGGNAVTFPRRAAREWEFLELVLFRLVAQPQLDWVDVERHCKFVHHGFEGEDPARLAGGPHEGRRMHVQAREAMARVDAGTGMQEPARVKERLRELLVGRGLLVTIV